MMDDTDRDILNIIQRDFPLEKDPLAVVGRKLGISGEEVGVRLKKLKQAGVIRRIGAVFDREALGWKGTLCAARVPRNKLDSFVIAVNALSGVTHNYRRSHDWNVWFTLIAPTARDIKATLENLRKQTGVGDIMDMKAVRTFKISATFDL